MIINKTLTVTFTFIFSPVAYKNYEFAGYSNSDESRKTAFTQITNKMTQAKTCTAPLSNTDDQTY